MVLPPPLSTPLPLSVEVVVVVLASSLIPLDWECVLAAAAPPGLRVLLPGSTAGSRRHGATSE
jgi:hypothetical protein